MALLCGFSAPFRSTTSQRGMHEPIHAQGAAHLPVLLNLSDFVVGRNWCIRILYASMRPPYFSRDWLEIGEELRSSSASVYALQTAIN